MTKIAQKDVFRICYKCNVNDIAPIYMYILYKQFYERKRRFLLLEIHMVPNKMNENVMKPVIGDIVK